MPGQNTLIDLDAMLGNLEHILQGHGQDVVLRDASEERTQPWGTPELIVVATAIAIWIGQTVGKAVLEQLVKRRMDKKSAEAIGKLEARIADLESALDQLKAQSHSPSVPQRNQILRETILLVEETCHTFQLEPMIALPEVESELKSHLASIGFTRRKSHILASQIAQTFPPELTGRTKE